MSQIKVKFRLNPRQYEAAATWAMTAPKEDPEKSCVYCGNIGGWVVTNGEDVPEQKLYLDKNTLIYEGDRTALRKGAAKSYHIIKSIFGNSLVARSAVTSYESDSTELPWNYDTESWITSGSPSTEFLFYINKAFPGTSDAELARNKLIERVGGMRNITMVRERPQAAAAGLNPSEIKLLRRVAQIA